MKRSTSPVTNFFKKIAAILGSLWGALVNFVVILSNGFQKIIFWLGATLITFSKILGLTIEKVFQGLYHFLKLILQFIKSVLLSIAALILSVGASIYFLSLSIDLSDSKPFQETRDFWITNAALAIERGWRHTFKKYQTRLPETLRYKGALPEIGLSELENLQRAKALSKYREAEIEKLVLYHAENFQKCVQAGYKVSEHADAKKCETPTGEVFHEMK